MMIIVESEKCCNVKEKNECELVKEELYYLCSIVVFVHKLYNINQVNVWFLEICCCYVIFKTFVSNEETTKTNY